MYICVYIYICTEVRCGLASESQTSLACFNSGSEAERRSDRGSQEMFAEAITWRCNFLNTSYEGLQVLSWW